MSLLLVTTWFGTFLIDTESGKIKKKKLFPKTISKLAENLNAIQTQEVLREEKELVKGIREPITVTEERLKALGEALESILSIGDLTITPEEFGFTQDLYRDALLELGKLRSRKAISKDHYIIQAVNGIDDLTHTTNLLSERLHEWYGLHWPELTKVVKDTEFVNLVSEFGDRDTILTKAKNEKLKSMSAEDSIGGALNSEDRTAVMDFGIELKNLQTTKIRLENYINTLMLDFAPNLTALTGPIIGARLIALTGGLERLAKVSSSTIQLLGAEKALFRHLKEGGNPPKHGIIFQHPLIHNAPYWQRGKIARAYAGKIAIAVKLDYNSEKFLGDELNSDLKRRVEEIKKKYPAAPKRAKKKGWRREESRGKWGGEKKKSRHGKHGKRRKK